MEPLPPAPEEQTAIAAGPPTTPKRIGWGWTAWLVILLGVAGIIGSRFLQFTSETEEAKPNKILELQAHYLVGMHRLIGALLPDLYKEAQQFNRGNADQRLSFVVLAGEIVGPAEALRQLDTLDQLLAKSDVRLSESQARVRAILGRLYADYEAGKYQAPAITANERTFLVERLGWFGELALHPPARLPRALEQAAPVAGAVIFAAAPQLPEVDGREEALRPATVTAIAIFCGATVAVIAAVIGFVGALGLLIQAALGGVTWRLRTGSPFGGVYAETFAIWLLLFFGLNVGLSLLPEPLPRLTNALIAMPASLLALGWPLLRGVPIRRMREDIGLVCESNPFVEFAAGVWCYIINLPLVVLGLAITIVLLRLQGIGVAPPEGAGGEAAPDFSSESLPSHPVVHMLAEADVATILQIYLLASVFAPIVEEIMFRGVLHRNCREWSASWGTFLSALTSTTIVSFIFAAVHPQGLATIPPLMFMAFGFSLAREWRGSLLPSMFAHGMSNGLVLTVALFALSR